LANFSSLTILWGGSLLYHSIILSPIWSFWTITKRIDNIGNASNNQGQNSWDLWVKEKKDHWVLHHKQWMGWSRTILEWPRTSSIKRRKQSKMGILMELYFDQKKMVGKLKQLTPIDSTQIQIFDTHLTQKWCIILGVSILVHSIKFMWMKRHETLFDQLSTCWHNLLP
jgi:hypothetical protein